MNWEKPWGCDSGTCVEVAAVGQIRPTVLVRNSRYPSNMVMFTPDEWAAFIQAAKNGQYDN